MARGVPWSRDGRDAGQELALAVDRLIGLPVEGERVDDQRIGLGAGLGQLGCLDVDRQLRRKPEVPAGVIDVQVAVGDQVQFQ